MHSVCFALFGEERHIPCRCRWQGRWSRCALALGACGGGDKQDENEPDGHVQGRRALAPPFPAGSTSPRRRTLKITVAEQGLARDPEPRRDRRRLLPAPRRPDASPTRSARSGSSTSRRYNSDSALTNTWTLGPVPRGRDAHLRVEGDARCAPAPTASATGSRRASTARRRPSRCDGGPPKGSFIVRISREPKSLEAELRPRRSRSRSRRRPGYAGSSSRRAVGRCTRRPGQSAGQRADPYAEDEIDVSDASEPARRSRPLPPQSSSS